MEDSKREIVLTRFPALLFQRESHTDSKNAWYRDILDISNTKLKTIYDSRFGHSNKIYKVLIPALYDPSLDIAGFPLCPGDFHSQNIT
jgi:hypothetical protein